MSVTFEVNNDTPDRELAAIACLIAVLRSNQPIPAPSRVSFDYADEEEVSPPPTEPQASESLLQQEAARAAEEAGAGELDSAGIPWNERIHSGTKVKNNDGSWRLKRNVDPALVTQVTAELKAANEAYYIGSTPRSAMLPAEPGTPPPPTSPESVPAADAAMAFGAGDAGGAADAPAPPAGDAPPPPPAGELKYPHILTRANNAGLDYDTLNAMAVDMGLEKFASLAKAPATTLRLFADTMEAKILELAAPAA